jgi:hypothetical protein
MSFNNEVHEKVNRHFDGLLALYLTLGIALFLSLFKFSNNFITLPLAMCFGVATIAFAIYSYIDYRKYSDDDSSYF